MFFRPPGSHRPHPPPRCCCFQRGGLSRAGTLCMVCVCMRVRPYVRVRLSVYSYIPSFSSKDWVDAHFSNISCRQSITLRLCVKGCVRSVCDCDCVFDMCTTTMQCKACGRTEAKRRFKRHVQIHAQRECGRAGWGGVGGGGGSFV